MNPFFQRHPLEIQQDEAIDYVKLINQFHAHKPGVFKTAINPQRISLEDWHFETGLRNDITDVKGIKVGHVSVLLDEPHQVRTGVTAILPHSDNLAQVGNMAYAASLNGFGEFSGLHIIQETGILNSPIILTSTFFTPAATEGVHRFYDKRYPGEWHSFLPVVGECYDGLYNTVEDRQAVDAIDVMQALEYAIDSPVIQGSIGAGTGMRAFDLKAGIGSASRKIEIAGQKYTIGVLVNTNHSKLEALNPAIKKQLEARYGSLEELQKIDEQFAAKRNRPAYSRQGSAVIVIATDLPLLPLQLATLCRRANMGIANTGSVMDVTSGDFAIAFSTTSTIGMDTSKNAITQTEFIHPDLLTPAYRAVAEAVCEAQINSIIASH